MRISDTRWQAVRFVVWCIAVPLLASLVFIVVSARAEAGASAGYDALAGIDHSRGAVLDQVEELGGEGSGPAVISPRPLLVTGRREVVGVGPKVLLIDAPFNISWRADSGDFAISVRRTEDDPAALSRRRGERDGMRVSSRTIVRLMQSVRALDTGDYRDIGPGRGRITQTHWGRYEIHIETSGAWRLRIRHRW